jgi:hypothetical protein
LSATHLTSMRTALARALSVDDVNQLGRDTGQSKRLRTITPHRLFLSMVAGLAGGQVDSLADLLREFNHQNDVTTSSTNGAANEWWGSASSCFPAKKSP